MCNLLQYVDKVVSTCLLLLMSCYNTCHFYLHLAITRVTFTNSNTYLDCFGAHGDTIEALRYKSEGRGFDSMVSLNFFIDKILLAALWPWG